MFGLGESVLTEVDYCVLNGLSRWRVVGADPLT